MTFQYWNSYLGIQYLCNNIPIGAEMGALGHPNPVCQLLWAEQRTYWQMTMMAKNIGIGLKQAKCIKKSQQMYQQDMLQIWPWGVWRENSTWHLYKGCPPVQWGHAWAVLGDCAEDINFDYHSLTSLFVNFFVNSAQCSVPTWRGLAARKAKPRHLQSPKKCFRWTCFHSDSAWRGKPETSCSNKQALKVFGFHSIFLTKCLTSYMWHGQLPMITLRNAIQ